MKKLLVVLLLLGRAAAAFAPDLSAGIASTVGTYASTFSYENLGIFDSYKERLSTVPFAFAAYFDATYGLASIGFRANGNTRQNITTVIGGSTTEWAPTDNNRSSGFLSFCVLGKFPLVLGPVSIFPLAGVEYDLMLYCHDDTGAPMSTDGLDQFWLKVGVGSDIKIYKGLYVRPLALIDFKLLNADERKLVQDTLDAGASTARMTDFAFEGSVQVGWRV